MHKRLDCSNFSTYNLRLAAHFVAVLVRDMSWNYVCKLLKVSAVLSQNTKNKDHKLIFHWACSSGDGMNVELSKSMMSFMGSLSFKFQSRTRLS